MSDNQTTSLYDSEAIYETDWRATWMTWVSGGWECRAPAAGVVYLRRHISGPVNPDDGMWMKGSISR